MGSGAFRSDTRVRPVHLSSLCSHFLIASSASVDKINQARGKRAATMKREISAFLIFPFLACILSACEEENFTDTRILENTGRICLQSVDAGDGRSILEIDARLSMCLSGCSVDIESTCEAAVTGDNIKITASGSYRETINGYCHDEYSGMRSECRTAALKNGLYSISYSKYENTFETGSDAGVLCFGAPRECN